MLYKQIEQNRRKTILLILFFTLLVLAVGTSAGYLLNQDYASGLVVTAVILAIYIPITYFTASSQVLSMAGARQIQEKDHPMLFHIVEELSLAARVPMPKVYVINDPSPNAFATGIRPEKGTVAFTTGLLERLNREELEAVAAHELAHIRNYDIRLMTVCIALVGVIALIADIGSRMMFYGGNKGNQRNQKSHPVMMLIAIVFLILSPLAAQFVHFAISRNREYLADATAVEFTRNSAGLRNALLKISQSTQSVRNAKPATAAMYISNPFRNKDKKGVSWFATHPPMESRIARLEKM